MRRVQIRHESNAAIKACNLEGTPQRKLRKHGVVCAKCSSWVKK